MCHLYAPISIVHSSASFLSYTPQTGTIVIDGTIIFGPPKEGQIIRILQVDGISRIYICNEELRKLYYEVRSVLQRELDLSTDPLLESSTVFQHIFLMPEHKDQHIHESLMVAQDEVSLLLWEKTKSFEGMEGQLRDDLMQDRLRAFRSYALAYLQRCPAEVFVRHKRQTMDSSYHVFYVCAWGIRFSFLISSTETHIVNVLWSQLSQLSNVGILLSKRHLRSIPLYDLFSSQDACEHPRSLSCDSSSPDAGDDGDWVQVARPTNVL